jgi:DNA-binding transcriptional MerR regulator
MCPAETVSATPLDYTRLTRKQAERAAGVSRATLARYVADGTLSAAKDQHGNNTYDASELQRVFPATFNLQRLEAYLTRDRVSPDETAHETGGEAIAIATLTVEKRYLTEERDRLREETERLRRELADEPAKREAERAEYLTLLQQGQETVKLLTDQAMPPPLTSPLPRRFLEWLRHRVR